MVITDAEIVKITPNRKVERMVVSQAQIDELLKPDNPEVWVLTHVNGARLGQVANDEVN